jgi:translation initiation factor 1
VSDRNTRLAYSTAGETAKPEQAGHKAPGPAAGIGGIRIRLDRRASDRVVTVVSGLPGPPAEIAALAKSLRSACGAGGTVKGGVVELQGDHRDRVESELSARGFKSRRAGG